jgi:hypothetical protein
VEKFIVITRIGSPLKRALAVLMVVTIVFMFGFKGPTGMANPDAAVFVDPKESSAEVGQTFAVNISISDVSGLLGFDFLLSYNTTVLQLISIQEGTFLKSVGPTFMINLTTNGVIWLAVTLYDVQGQLKSANGTGVLATAEFKAMAVGESVLDLFSKDPYKPDEVKLATDPPPNDVVPIPNVAVDGHVVVSPDPPNPNNATLVGDVNGDGKVDMRDVGEVARLFHAPPTDPLWNPKCDFNGDGKVDMKDVGLVASRIGDRL